MLTPRRRFIIAASAAALSSVLPTRSRVAWAQTAAPPGDSSPTNASRHYISFEAPINETTSSRLISVAGGLIQRGANEIHLIVGTGGGSVAAALLVHGFFRGLPAKLTTYNLSTIQSAGGMIFLAGERRIASQNAIFMFHPFRETFSSNSSLTLDDLKDRQAFLSMDLKRVDDIYRERTSLTDAQMAEFKQHAVYFDAAAARDAGIIHEIAPLSIPPHASITTVTP